MEKLHTKITYYLILSTLFFLPVYLIKIKIGWLSSNALELLIGLLLIVQILNRQIKYKIFSTGYAAAAFFIFSGLFLSTVANGNYYVGLGAIKGWFIFPIVFGIVFYDALIKDGRLLKKSLLALFYSGAAVSVIGIMYKFSGIVTFDDRLKIFWDSPNQLAMFLAVPFLIGVLRIEKSGFEEFRELRSRKEKAGLWKNGAIIFGILLIFFNLYFTYSYGAWLAIAVALVGIFWLKYKEKLRRKYLFIMILIFISIIGAISLGKFEQIKNLGDRSSLASRVTIWKSAGLMIENNPIFGIGPGNFQEKYLEYQKYFPPYLEWSAPQPHNIFLAFWLESGLVGLAGFIWLLILFFRDNKKTIKNDRDLGILFLAIITYILAHGLVDTTYWRNDLAVAFWAVVAANYYLAKKRGIL